MQMQIGPWLVDVDIPLNMEISAAQAREHCTCGYCRNFYAAVDVVCPSLRPFLAKMGIDAEGPDELSPFEPTIYEVSYIINGSILESSDEQILIDGIPVKILASSQADMDTTRPEPYFVLIIGLMELPWLMDEDPAQVISPANEDNYLQRMQRKLLDRAAEENLFS